MVGEKSIGTSVVNRKQFVDWLYGYLRELWEDELKLTGYTQRDVRSLGDPVLLSVVVPMQNTPLSIQTFLGTPLSWKQSFTLYLHHENDPILAFDFAPVDAQKIRVHVRNLGMVEWWAQQLKEKLIFAGFLSETAENPSLATQTTMLPGQVASQSPQPKRIREPNESDRTRTTLATWAVHSGKCKSYSDAAAQLGIDPDTRRNHERNRWLYTEAEVDKLGGYEYLWGLYTTQYRKS